MGEVTSLMIKPMTGKKNPRRNQPNFSPLVSRPF